VIQAEAGWFGEGDEFFFVDGAARPNIEGTGTEDYFNDAWSLREADGPYTGVTIAQGTGLASRMSAYRWHVLDPVPFTRSLRFEIEHAGWTYREDGSVRSGFEERADLFSSVAFWYQQDIARDLPDVPYGPARLPHGNARQIEVEQSAATVETEGGKAEVQKEVFWSRDLLFFQAKGPGSKMRVPFEVNEAGDYELVAQVAHAPDYGIYEVLLDGKPIASDVRVEHEPGANLGGVEPIDAWHHEIYVAEDHTLGWKRLTQGRHVLTFVCTGRNLRSTGYNLGIDTLVLARLGRVDEAGGSRAEAVRRSPAPDGIRRALGDSDPFVREAAAWRLTQEPSWAARMTAELSAGLKDPDFVVRGLAALGFGAAGKAALPALPQMVAALKDPEESVRMVAAEAIAHLGTDAAPAVPALVAAAGVKGEHVHVLRSLARALGSIGPAAAPAIPVLESLQRIPRVQWAAEDAMRRIRN